MNGLARIVGGSYVWLTALMTLVAGFPHVSCRCPNGNVKPFCLETMLGIAGCCCGGVHPAETSVPEKPKSCCCQHSEPARSTGPQVGPRSCQKTPAAAEIFSPSHDKTTVAKDLTPALWLPNPSGVGLESTAAGNVLYALHLLGPPTDLTTTLQRLLI